MHKKQIFISRILHLDRNIFFAILRNFVFIKNVNFKVSLAVKILFKNTIGCLILLTSFFSSFINYVIILKKMAWYLVCRLEINFARCTIFRNKKGRFTFCWLFWQDLIFLVLYIFLGRHSNEWINTLNWFIDLFALMWLKLRETT